MQQTFNAPEIRSKEGIFPRNPVVFYSPRLNTCLYLNRYGLEGRTVTPPKNKYSVEMASVEDLLTGQTIEEHQFDLNIQEELDASRTFENQAVSRYGPGPERP
jgi:hypothetical protein